MPRLVFSKSAREDLAGIEARIKEESGSNETGQNFVEQIILKCSRLSGFESRIGRPRPELLPDLRSSPYRNYVIFFRYVADSFYVVNILHGAPDIDAYFADKNGGHHKIWAFLCHRKRERDAMSGVPSEDAERLRWLEAQAEEAYDRMYDAGFSGAAGYYSDAKEFLYDAIGLARRLGKTDEAERLSRRLAHIKAVFRGQFTS